MHYGCQSMVSPIHEVLLKRPEAAFRSQTHLDENAEAYGYIGVPAYEQVLEEYAAFEAAFASKNIKVHYLPEAASVGLDSIYTHDPLKITQKGAIYFPMGKQLRRNEGAATRSYLESIGVPTLGVIEAPATIEGGDVLWIDERTVAIGRGHRTNDAGIAAFTKLIEGCVDEVLIVPMPHGDGPEACLHLMSVISFVDTDLAVVFSKYMPVFFREWLINRGIELIETPEEEYNNLGTNVLALAPREVVMPKGNPIVEAALLSKGVKVHTYSGNELSYKGTGGPTCLSCPILRR